jgi:hypothetical protein
VGIGGALRGKGWGREWSCITRIDGFWRHLKFFHKFDWRRDADWGWDFMIGVTLRRQRWGG